MMSPQRINQGKSRRDSASPLRTALVALTTLAGLLLAPACGGGSEADQLGIAAMCQDDTDCAQVVVDGKEVQLSCITDLKDGYCTIPDCTNDADCPTDATCVAYTDGSNYCFRECSDKAECNVNRTPDSEANCSSNFDYADPDDDIENKKACIPPSN